MPANELGAVKDITLIVAILSNGNFFLPCPSRPDPSIFALTADHNRPPFQLEEVHRSKFASLVHPCPQE